jgi:N-acetylneuraminate synthase/N,N'-diacetyllegionaminate synthase
MKKNTWEGKHGPLLIAEIGGNHEGDFEYAKKLTQLAIESDVDYIKFQLYSGDSLVSRLESPVRNKHFKKFELSQENYIELAQMCQNAGVKFMASVWDPDYFDWIDSFMDIYKIGSGDLTAYPVLKKTAAIGKPIIISTGLSTMAEVEEAVQYIQSCNPIYKTPSNLSVLQCTAMYPIPAGDANLDVMMAYKATLKLPIGYSDHTEGLEALEVAVAKGAQVLEFHFTDSREGKEFRDHKVSLTKEEVHVLIARIKKIKELSGSNIKEPLAVEGDHVISFRRAIYPKKDLKKGHILTEDDLITLRPNHGIDAREFENVVGRVLLVDKQAHEKMSWEDLADVF